MSLDPESILEIAVATDPFRAQQHLNLERITAQEFEQQKSEGKRIQLWKTNQNEINERRQLQDRNNNQEESLETNSHAGTLTTSSTSTENSNSSE